MRPPRVLARSFPLIPAISTVYDSVQLLGFVLSGRLTLIHSLYDSCSSGQSFAAGFLRIPRHRRHPCLWLYPSHCRADSGLSPVRACARRAHYKKSCRNSAGFLFGGPDRIRTDDPYNANVMRSQLRYRPIYFELYSALFCLSTKLLDFCCKSEFTYGILFV